MVFFLFLLFVFLLYFIFFFFFFFSSRRRHTRSLCDWSSDVCSSDLVPCAAAPVHALAALGRAGARSRRPEAAHRADGRRPFARQPAARLPVPSALPAPQKEPALPHRGPRAAGRRPRAARRLSLRRGADVSTGALLALQVLTNLAIVPASAGVPRGIHPPHRA